VTTDPLADVAALPEVFDAVEAARGSVDALLRDLRAPELRGRVAGVTAAALRASARASATLELGSDIGLPAADAFGPPFADDDTGRTAAGAWRLSVQLGALAATFERAPGQALARAHALAAAGLVDADALGRPRSEPGVADRLRGLSEVVTARTDAPAAVVAAVVHGELLSLRPFGTGDGLVARAAVRMVLMTRGLDPQAVTVPEAGHLAQGSAAYAAALAAYASGTREGVAKWVVHCATALAVGARDGRALAAVVAASSRSA